MKKALYLLRHSYAGRRENSDIDRALTIKGVNTARSLGRKLLNDHFNPDKIICSPSARTKQTTINLMEELEISEQMIEYMDKIYMASVRELMEIVNGINKTVKSALLIGHNPAISFFAEYLTSSKIGVLEPCGLVTIDFDVMTWGKIAQDSGNFVSYYHKKC